jgi:hypothetical protein
MNKQKSPATTEQGNKQTSTKIQKYPLSVIFCRLFKISAYLPDEKR